MPVPWPKSFPAPAAFFFLTVVVIAAFYPLFIGRFYAVGDIRDVYIPIEHFFHSQLIAGRLPAWMADAAWGFPVIASAQIGFFYPPLLISRLLPVNFYLPWLLLSHFLWLSLGSFLLFRCFRLSSPAAALGALAFTLGGFVTLHLTHLNIIFCLAWLPWQFFYIYRIANSPLSIKAFLPLSLLLSLPFLVGQIQIPLLMFLVSAAWFAYLRHQSSLSFRRSVVWLVLLAILVPVLSAAQLLPTYELMSQSTRNPTSVSFDITRANQHSFPLYHLPTFLFPRFFANDDQYWGRRLQIEYGVYVGTFPLLIAIFFLLCHYRQKIKLSPTLTRLTPFFTGLLAVSLLLSLGSLSPFRLIGLEPSLWLFSAPARWLLFTALSLSFFAAVGADHFFHSAHTYLPFFRRTFFLLLGLVVLGQLFLWVLSKYFPAFAPALFTSAQQEKIFSLLASANASSLSLASPYTWLPLLVCLLMSRHFVTRHPVRWALVLTAADLFLLFTTTTPTLPWSDIKAPPASFAQLPAAVTSGQARLYSVRTGGDTGAYFTNPSSRANAAIRRTQRELLVPLTHAQFSLPGIEWPASLDLANSSALLSELRADGSYQLANPILAAKLNIGVYIDEVNQSIAVHTMPYYPRLELIGADGATSSIRYPYHPSGAFTVDLQADQPSVLIVRDSYYPGWQAVLDGVAAPISVYQKIFRQIQVPAGRHVISFFYRPVFLYIGLAISASAWLLIILWLLYFRRRS